MVNKDFCLSSYMAFRYIWKDGVDFVEGFQHKNFRPVEDKDRIPVKTSEDIDMTFENVQANQNAVQETYSYNIQKTYTGVGSYVFPLGSHSGVKLDAGWNVTYGLIKRKTQIKADNAMEFSLDSLLCGTTRSDFGGLLGNLSYM